MNGDVHFVAAGIDDGPTSHFRSDRNRRGISVYIFKNHAFVDGNKRTALAACLVFLEENSLLPDSNLPINDWEQFVLDVASSQLDRAATTHRLRKLLKKPRKSKRSSARLGSARLQPCWFRRRAETNFPFFSQPNDKPISTEVYFRACLDQTSTLDVTIWRFDVKNRCASDETDSLGSYARKKAAKREVQENEVEWAIARLDSIVPGQGRRRIFMRRYSERFLRLRCCYAW